MNKLVNGVEVPLTQDDIKDLEILNIAHEEFMAKLKEEEYLELRKQNYPTPEELVIALVEKDVDGDSTNWDALMIKRQEVKLEFPKPEPVQATK